MSCSCFRSCSSACEALTQQCQCLACGRSSGIPADSQDPCRCSPPPHLQAPPAPNPDVCSQVNPGAVVQTQAVCQACHIEEVAAGVEGSSAAGLWFAAAGQQEQVAGGCRAGPGAAADAPVKGGACMQKHTHIQKGSSQPKTCGLPFQCCSASHQPSASIPPDLLHFSYWLIPNSTCVPVPVLQGAAPGLGAHCRRQPEAKHPLHSKGCRSGSCSTLAPPACRSYCSMYKMYHKPSLPCSFLLTTALTAPQPLTQHKLQQPIVQQIQQPLHLVRTNTCASPCVAGLGARHTAVPTALIS